MDHGGRHRIRNGNGNGTDEGSEDDDDDSGMEWEEVPAEAVAASTSQRERAQQELAEAARAQEQEKTAIISAAPSSSSTAKKRKGGPSTSTQENEDAPSQATTSDAIEVTLGAALANKFAAGTGKTGRKKNSGPSALSIEATLHRAHLQELHKLHAATLLVAGHVRNGWLNDATLRARLLSKVPLVVQNPFFNYGKATHPKASDRSRLFESALRGLLNWWNDRFYVEDARPRSIDLAIASVLDDLDQKYGRVSAAASRQQQQQQQQRAGGGGLPTASSKRETGDDKVLLELLRNPCSLRTEDYADMHDLLAALTQKDRTRLMMPFAEEEHLRELAAAFAPPPPAASPFKTSSASAKSKSSSSASASASAAPTPALPMPKAMSAELGELIRNPQSLAKRAVKMAGSHDMSVQLFTATCRALDVPARLVCALPALDYRSRNKIRADDKIGVADEAASASGAVGQLRNSLKPGRKGKGKSRAKGTGPGKRKRGANGTGTGTGTATSTGGNTSASVSYAEEEEEEEANSDEDAEFEEVAIPSSLPSAARKKANVNAIGAAASKAATSNSNGKGKRPSVAAAIFAGTGTPKSGHGSDASATGSAKSAAGTQQRMTAKSAASPTQASGVRSAPGGLIASRKGKNRAPVEDEDDIVAGVPTFWTEVYNRPNQEWMTVDVIRGRIRPRKGEMDNGRLFYAIAYEVDQYVKDVTPRYAKSFAGRTLKMRIAKKRKDEADWWEATLAPFSRPFVLGREMKEDEELERMQEAEPMPTVLEGFKNHPRFLLERHLKREEALLPKTRQLGLFRGEPVFPRSAVVDVKSAESWMREGRVVSEGQQPLKNVKQRAVTIQKRRMQEMAEQDGHEGIMQGLYSRKQTELVVPPPVVDGKVPKNSYGNLDLFAPHMLPAGGVHLPFKSIRKVAKDLGVDFAEAVTGFEFHKRRAIPVIDGIVVAVEVREMLLEAFYASETLAVEKEAQKRKERCLKRWKKLIVGLRVRSRIQGEYHKGGTKQSNAGQPAQGGSGAGEQNGAEQEGVSQFQALPEDDAQLAGAPEVRDQPPDPSAGPGGFINGTLQQEIPGGAAFPSMPVPLAGNDVSADPGTGEMPAVDFTSLKLPPMPAPAPAPAKAGGNGMDLDEFTLADPEELAEGGIDPDDESEPDQALAGGFVRVEDEEASSQIGQVNAKDFARQTMPSSRSEPEGSDASHGGSMENDVEVDAPRLRRQRAQASQKEEKAKIRVGNGSSSGRPARRALDDDEDAEEGALSAGGDSPASDPASADDDEEDDEEGEADFEVPAASSRPARATRTSARTTKGGPAGTIETSSTPNTRRSGRSTKSAATPVTASGPAASTRSTRASHRKKVTNPEEESEVKPQRSSGRPTRAVAQRSGKKAIVDISSGTEGEGSDN